MWTELWFERETSESGGDGEEGRDSPFDLGRPPRPFDLARPTSAKLRSLIHPFDGLPRSTHPSAEPTTVIQMRPPRTTSDRITLELISSPGSTGPLAHARQEPARPRGDVKFCPIAAPATAVLHVLVTIQSRVWRTRSHSRGKERGPAGHDRERPRGTRDVPTPPPALPPRPDSCRTNVVGGGCHVCGPSPLDSRCRSGDRRESITDLGNSRSSTALAPSCNLPIH